MVSTPFFFSGRRYHGFAFIIRNEMIHFGEIWKMNFVEQIRRRISALKQIEIDK